MFKISIITVNYNDAKGLERTITSVINQSSLIFEYIVIDGGSTDASLEVIKKYQNKINFFVSEKDSGIYNAMNKGIKVAKGEYLFFLNSGDHLFENNVLENNHKFIIVQDIVYFNLQIIDKIEKFVKNYPDELSFSYFVKDSLPHPATFIKKTVFDRVGHYDESLTIVSDWKFFIESVCKFNYSYKRIDETLSTFYLDGLSSDPNNKDLIFDEKHKVLSSHFQAYLKDNNQFSELKSAIVNLRESKKIKLLVKLGLINKF